MFAITAIADSRLTGEPEYFVLRALLPGTGGRPDPLTPEVVYHRRDLVDFLEALGKVVVVRAQGEPHGVRVRYGTHGYRFIESHVDGRSSDALRRAPRFAFVNEASREDVQRLLSIDRGEHADASSEARSAWRRYAELGWLRLADGVPQLTEIGRALPAYV